MGSGPIRGSGSRSREQQQGSHGSLPPWVKSVERTSGSPKAGSVLSIVAPESSTATRAPLRTIKPSSRPPAMAEKDSSAFQNASHVFVVFGASVSWLVGAFGSQKWLLFGSAVGGVCVGICTVCVLCIMCMWLSYLAVAFIP